MKEMIDQLAYKLNKFKYDYKIKVLSNRLIIFWQNKNQWSVASINFDDQKKFMFVLNRI